MPHHTNMISEGKLSMLMQATTSKNDILILITSQQSARSIPQTRLYILANYCCKTRRPWITLSLPSKIPNSENIPISFRALTLRQIGLVCTTLNLVPFYFHVSRHPNTMCPWNERLVPLIFNHRKNFPDCLLRLRCISTCD